MEFTKLIREQLTNFEEQIERLVALGLVNSAKKLFEDAVISLIKHPYVLNREIKYLVHYTSISALFSLLNQPTDEIRTFKLSGEKPFYQPDKSIPSDQEEIGFLRMYDTVHSSDPNEGQYFASIVGDSQVLKAEYLKLWKKFKEKTRTPAYISSFRGVHEAAEIDDLVYWCTHGKGGMGCAIGIPVSCIANIPFVYQIQYGVRSVDNTLHKLTSWLDYLSNPNAIKHRKLFDIESGVPDFILEGVWPIPYLHKSDDFRFEEEVRIVSPMQEPDEEVWCEQIYDGQLSVSLRHFTHISELNARNLLTTGSKILIGPAVKHSANIVNVVNRRLRFLDMSGPEVSESQIAYRP